MMAGRIRNAGERGFVPRPGVDGSGGRPFPDDEPDLSFRCVRKEFGDVVAVDDVSFDVDRAEFVTLLGPSGCGKTTILRLIGGFLEPTAGEILIRGRDVSRMPPYARDTLMVFQDYALFPHMTVQRNVGFGLRMQHVRHKEARPRVEEALRLVGLSDTAKRYPHQLSGGQQQRVALARALVLEPPLLLLDEPLGALDAQLRRSMQLELRDMQRRLQVTFIYVTHDQEEALTMSDRLAIMNEGRIEQVGTPREVYDRPANAFVARFLGECNLLPARVERVEGQSTVARVEGVGDVVGVPPEGEVLRPGEDVFVAVRPEWVKLGPGDGQGFRAEVEHTIFAGPNVRYDLRLGGHELIVRAAATDGPAPGEEVDISWTRQQCVILR
jgi:spermidine/putrescine ABC transporter ATP-binding subunit